jgi:hypothetical protein
MANLEKLAYPHKAASPNYWALIRLTPFPVEGTDFANPTIRCAQTLAPLEDSGRVQRVPERDQRDDTMQTPATGCCTAGE